eukprot:m51a1_g2951 hypothetical protein (903) ;mRNA; r:638777-641562
MERPRKGAAAEELGATARAALAALGERASAAARRVEALSRSPDDSKPRAIHDAADDLADAAEELADAGERFGREFSAGPLQSAEVAATVKELADRIAALAKARTSTAAGILDAARTVSAGCEALSAAALGARGGRGAALSAVRKSKSLTDGLVSTDVLDNAAPMSLRHSALGVRPAPRGLGVGPGSAAPRTSFRRQHVPSGATGPRGIDAGARVMKAAEAGDAGLVASILRSEPSAANYEDADGRTPLIVACQDPNAADVVHALIRAGASVSMALAESGETPLCTASRSGSSGAVEALLAAPECRAELAVANSAPLLAAIENGHEGVARLLVEAGALLSGSSRRAFERAGKGPMLSRLGLLEDSLAPPRSTVPLSARPAKKPDSSGGQCETPTGAVEDQRKTQVSLDAAVPQQPQPQQPCPFPVAAAFGRSSQVSLMSARRVQENPALLTNAEIKRASQLQLVAPQKAATAPPRPKSRHQIKAAPCSSGDDDSSDAELSSDTTFAAEYKGNTQELGVAADRIDCVEQLLSAACAVFGVDEAKFSLEYLDAGEGKFVPLKGLRDLQSQQSGRQRLRLVLRDSKHSTKRLPSQRGLVQLSWLDEPAVKILGWEEGADVLDLPRGEPLHDRIAELAGAGGPRGSKMSAFRAVQMAAIRSKRLASDFDVHADELEARQAIRGNCGRGLGSEASALSSDQLQLLDILRSKFRRTVQGYEHISTLLLWLPCTDPDGCTKSLAASGGVCASARACPQSGKFGKGVYLTLHAQHAAELAAADESGDRAIALCLVAVGSVYAVTRQIDYDNAGENAPWSICRYHRAHPLPFNVVQQCRKDKGAGTSAEALAEALRCQDEKALRMSFDAHVVGVSRNWALQCAPTPEVEYHAVVVSDESLVLPVAIVRLCQT